MNNRRRATLFLIEQLLAILFFALTAAVCAQIFVSAQVMAEENAARDQAALLAQNAAEAYKAAKGDLAQTAAILTAEAAKDRLSQGYDAAGRPCAGDAAVYTLILEESSSAPPGLRQAGLLVTDAAGKELIAFAVGAQGVI